MAMDLSNLLVPAMMFFALGLFAQLLHSDLKFPPDLTKALTIYLLVGIGLHGGKELANVEFAPAIAAVVAAIGLGVLLPIVAYAMLRGGRIDRLNASAIAAHYGSVSAGTFLTAVAFLDSMGVKYETYPLIMLAIMESPAILIGLVLASMSRRAAGEGSARKGVTGSLVREAFTNGSIVLLFGSMLIGAVGTTSSVGKIMPFFDTVFMGVLCLFLLDMGMEAGRRLGDFRRVGGFLIGFGLVMPLLGGAVGLAVGHWLLGFGVGGTLLVAVLGASASYIAVPPAMRLAIPEANPSFYLTLSLGVTFPFNVVIGIPLYYSAAQWLAA